MPAETEKQRRFMGADLARLRAGQPTRTGMSETKLREFSRKTRASSRRGSRRSGR